MQGQLPTLVNRKVVNRHKEARQNEKKTQEYNERYTNRKNGVRKSDVKVGNVLVRQQHKNKLTSHFSPTLKREHSRVTARNDCGHVITRHVSHFKLIPKQQRIDSDDSDQEDTRHDPPGPNAENRDDNEEALNLKNHHH